MKFLPRVASRRARTAVLAATTAVAAGLLGGLGPARPAQAAPADIWGFAYSDTMAPTTWTIMDTTRQWGSWKAAHPGDWAWVIRTSPGSYRVRMPWLASSQRGVAHVTAVSPVPRWCTVVGWNSSTNDRFIDVQCASPGGTPADTRFTVLFTASTWTVPPASGSHAYVHYDGAIMTSYNSAGGGNAVTPVGTGVYLVRLPLVGLSNTLAGNVQVTATRANGQPYRCKVLNGWLAAATDVQIPVGCFEPVTSAPANSGFTLSYHRQRSVTGALAPPNQFGYAWQDPAAVPSTNFNNGLGGYNFNTVTAFGGGAYQFLVPLAGVAETTLQLTGYGNQPGYCTIADWSHAFNNELQSRISCFDAAGAYANQSFFATATSRT